MGGMHTLEYALMYPNLVKNIATLASSGRHSAWCISWGEAQRQSIFSDPNFNGGYYTADKKPDSGLIGARMSAMLTYRSMRSFESRFGRETVASSEFAANAQPRFKNKLQPCTTPPCINTDSPAKQIYSAQSYLRYQGQKFINRFDANCYIAITNKLDSHDISRGRVGLNGDASFEGVCRSIPQACLIIGAHFNLVFYWVLVVLTHGL